ncbi:MAG: phosphoribosylglycinamide formyltransferase [Candidatus Longimicrobiales bacterium M2_2A_002]
MSERLAVFASGSGTNLQALIDHFDGSDTVDVALVISDTAGCGALERAQDAGIATHHIPVKTRPIAAVSADTIDALESARIDLVALAGYLRLIPPAVVRRFHYRILNIHPALLPSFGGKGMYGSRVHQAVLDAGCRITGPTVHMVDERYDHGRILAQWPVPVLEDDNAETLGKRVLAVEHVLYPAAVEWLARVLAVAEGDDAAAVREAMPIPVREDVCYCLEEGGDPDRQGVRRIFGLD